MSTQSLGKVGLTRNTFNSEQDRIDHIQLSNGDPNGVVSSFKGSICLDVSAPALYQNVDGCTQWDLLLGSGITPFILEGVVPFKVTYSNLTEPFLEIWEVVNAGSTFEVPVNGLPIFKYTYFRNGAIRTRTYVFNSKGMGTYGSGEEPTVSNDFILLFSSDPEDKTLHPDNISLNGMGAYFESDVAPYRLDDWTDKTQEDLNRVFEQKLINLENSLSAVNQGAVSINIDTISGSPILSTPTETCSLRLDGTGDVVTEILINSNFLDQHLFTPMGIFLNDSELANTIHCIITNAADGSKAFFKVLSVTPLSGYFKLGLQVDPLLNSETLKISNTSLTEGDAISFQFYPGESGSSNGSGGSSTYQGIIGYWIDSRPIYRSIVPFNNTTVQGDSVLIHNLGIDLYISESYVIPGLGRLVPSYQTPGDLLSTGYVSKYTPTQNQVRLDFVNSDAYSSGLTWYYIVEYVKGNGTIVDVEPPSAPILSYNNVGHTYVNLTWVGADDNIGVYSYNVYQGGIQIMTNVSSTEVQARGLSPSTPYNFYVTAVDSAGNESVNSNTVYLDTIADPSSGDVTPPTGVVLSSNFATFNEIGLTWTTATDNIAVIAYNLYIDNVLTFSVPVNIESYTMLGLSPDTSYDFKVRAVDAAGNESVDSNILTVSTIGQDVSSPTAPTLSTGNITSTSIELLWTAATDDVAVSSYNVYIGGSFLINVSSLGYVVTGLTPDTGYSFYVRAIDTSGNQSADSNTLTPSTNPDSASPATATVDDFILNQDINSGVAVGITITQAHVTVNYNNSQGYNPDKIKILTLPSYGEFRLNGILIVGDEIILSALAANQFVWYPQNLNLSNTPPATYSEDIIFQIIDDQNYLSATATLTITGADLAQIPSELLKVGSVSEVITTTLYQDFLPETSGVELELATTPTFDQDFVSLPINPSTKEYYVSTDNTETGTLKNDLIQGVTYYARIKRSVGVYTNVVTFSTAVIATTYRTSISLGPELTGVNVRVDRTTPVLNFSAKDSWTVTDADNNVITNMTADVVSTPSSLQVIYNLKKLGEASTWEFVTPPSFLEPIRAEIVHMQYKTTNPTSTDYLLTGIPRIIELRSTTAREVRGLEWLLGIASFLDTYHEEGPSTQTALRIDINSNIVTEVYDNCTLTIEHYRQAQGALDVTTFVNQDLSSGDVSKVWVANHPAGLYQRIRQIRISQAGSSDIIVDFDEIDSVVFVSGITLT